MNPHDPKIEGLPIDPDVDRATPWPISRRRPGTLAAIAVGGSAGTLCRALLGDFAPVRGTGFPVTTMAVNVVGSLLLGLLMVLLIERFDPPPNLRPLLTTGFLGGFTTFSTFMVETTLLGRDGLVLLPLLYLGLSVVLGVAAAWLGIMAGTHLVPSEVKKGTNA